LGGDVDEQHFGVDHLQHSRPHAHRGVDVAPADVADHLITKLSKQLKELYFKFQLNILKYLENIENII